MKQYNADGYPKMNTHNKMIDVRQDVAKGVSPTDAINRHCNTAESYAAGLIEYGLKPTSNDYD